MWFILCICFGILMLLAGVAVWCWLHMPKGLSRQEISNRNYLETRKGKCFWFEFWYPVAYEIYTWVKRRGKCVINEEKINQLQKVYIGKARAQLEEFYYCHRFIVLLWMMTIISSLGVLGGLWEHKDAVFDGNYHLLRQEPGGGQSQVSLIVEANGDSKEITIPIPERQYTAEEVQVKMEEAKKYIYDNYLGENSSSRKVSRPLRLVSRIPDSQLQVEWLPDGTGYINKDGTLNLEEVQEEVEVELIAVISYQDKKEKISFSVLLSPIEKSEQELFWEKWQQSLNHQKEESQEKAVFSLPKKVNGEVVSYEEKDSGSYAGILVLGLIVLILTPAYLDYRTEQKIIRREEELRREYPELVERFILLIGAGLTIRGAWYRIAEDYQKRCLSGETQKRYLYEEMLITRRALENGQSEVAAYSEFGRRLSLVQYMRFNTLLVQNLRKGSEDLLQRMDFEAKDALRERRELARKSGEEAETKLLIPMMLMLVIVFAMILVAAFQNI